MPTYYVRTDRANKPGRRERDQKKCIEKKGHLLISKIYLFQIRRFRVEGNGLMMDLSLKN